MGAPSRVRAGDVKFGQVSIGLVKLDLQVMPQSTYIFPGTAKVDLFWDSSINDVTSMRGEGICHEA